MCICSEAVSLRAWSALVGLVVSREPRAYMRACRNCGCARFVHAVAAATCRSKRGAMTAHTVQIHSTEPVVERQRVTVFGVAAFSRLLF